MASKLPAVKGAAYTFRAVLFAQTGNQIKTSPTIAAGDFQVSTDGGAFGNLATIPAESPASSGQVLVTLSTSEMNGDEILVRAIDASGDEWHAQAWTIHTAAQTFDTTDGVADAIKAKTDNLPTDPADQSAVETAITSATSPLATSAEVGALNDISAADVWAAGTRTLTASTNLNDISAADVWAAGVRTLTAGTKDSEIDSILADTGELQGDWADGGRLDTILDAAGSAGDPWATELPGAYGAGTAGEIIGGFSSDLTTAIAGLASTSTVTVINTVVGGDATVYQYATWKAIFTLSGSPGLTDYENVIFAVKGSASTPDAQAILYVNSATGLLYIGGGAASGPTAGSLTISSDTVFVVDISAAEVASKIASTYAGTYTWSLKGIETGTTPDEAVFISGGSWRIEPGVIRAVA